MAKTAVIILVHGSRGERGIVEVPQVWQRVAQGLRLLLPPEVEVIGAALQFNHPNLQEAVESLVAQEVSRIIVAPYFLFPGRHVTEHIPQLIERLKCAYPETQFVVADNLGLDEYFIELVARRIVAAAPGLSPDTRGSFSTPEAIEQQSMEIVERLLPPLNLSVAEKIVVKRIVHASGDSQIARLIKFSPLAVASGVSAIAKGSPIFTDVRMVAVGINSHLVEACGCSLFCAGDEINPKHVEGQATTRAAAAVYHLGTRLNGAVVAIGNAPTALLALLDLIDHREIAPALVIGMPVGFVQAKEAKAELMRRDVPYITVIGTRGGSAMAAATVNSLLRIAVDKHLCNSLNQ